jgi:hypothetical protein
MSCCLASPARDTTRRADRSTRSCASVSAAGHTSRRYPTIASAARPSSIRRARVFSSSAVSRFTRPISFRYSRTVSEVPPSPVWLATRGDRRRRPDSSSRRSSSPGLGVTRCTRSSTTGRSTARSGTTTAAVPQASSGTVSSTWSPTAASASRTVSMTSWVGSTCRITCATSSPCTTPSWARPAASNANHSSGSTSSKGGRVCSVSVTASPRPPHLDRARVATPRRRRRLSRPGRAPRDGAAPRAAR